LVIEVSIATLGIDRAKADVYAAAGIPEYWIVSPETREIEIHRQPGPDGYRERMTLTAAQDVLQPPLPALSPISVEQLFA
jgi:Uma2 family endonuclease